MNVEHQRTQTRVEPRGGARVVVDEVELAGGRAVALPAGRQRRQRRARRVVARRRERQRHGGHELERARVRQRERQRLAAAAAAGHVHAGHRRGRQRQRDAQLARALLLLLRHTRVLPRRALRDVAARNTSTPLRLRVYCTSRVQTSDYNLLIAIANVYVYVYGTLRESEKRERDRSAHNGYLRFTRVMIDALLREDEDDYDYIELRVTP